MTKEQAITILTGDVLETNEQTQEAVAMAVNALLRSDVSERNVGKWLEKDVIPAEEAEEIIAEWQSCRCSVCGRYDTRPYLYSFMEPIFCSWCGADMRGTKDG